MELQWAGENQLEERPLLSKRAEEQLKRRKEIIEQKLHQKRISSTQKKELFTTKVITAQEVINEEHLLEEAGDKGLPVLTKHQKHKKKPRKSKKRCWFCKKPDHLKRKCPHIRCWYCNRLGHIKADCRDKKMDFIMNLVVKAKKKKQRNKKRKEKDQKKHKEITEIYKKRLQESEFKFKDGEYELQWNGLRIGEYMALGLPKPLQELKESNIHWKKVDMMLRAHTPIKNLKIMEGMLNSCTCGEIELPRGNFIQHINNSHNGYAPPGSRINQPHWIYGIMFDDDQIEMLYCRTQADLS